jgi:hypothetical protein
VLITNENDLTQHYGNALLPDKDVHATANATCRPPGLRQAT